MISREFYLLILISLILSLFGACKFNPPTEYKNMQYLSVKEKETINSLIIDIYKETFKNEFENEKAILAHVTINVPKGDIDYPIVSLSLLRNISLSEKEIKDKIKSLISSQVVEVTTSGGKKKSFQISEYSIDYAPPGPQMLPSIGIRVLLPGVVTIIPFKVKIQEFE